MKHKTNVGPGLIVALGAPSDDASSLRSDAASAGKIGIGDSSGEAPEVTRGARMLPEDSNMDSVPLSFLSMPDDQEQMQPPEVGDVVNYQVTGKVVAIEGSYAQVQRQSINGQELPDAEPDETNPDESGQNANQSSDDGEGQSLRGQAAGIGMLS